MITQTRTAIVTDQRSFTEVDASHVVVVRFRAGRYRLDLHAGSQDPPVAMASLPASAWPSVSSTERPALLAAFNGGFKSNAYAGGFEVDGHAVFPLLAGLASLIIYSNGTGTVGVWPAAAARPGEQVVSVRQNLQPLIVGGRPNAQIGVVGAWGATLGGVSAIARSGLGVDSQGDLLYAGSMRALPADIADALAAAGATTAMELDINPYWVQMDVAVTPGGPITSEIPGQWRPSDQYLVGWTRDFVTVLART